MRPLKIALALSVVVSPFVVRPAVAHAQSYRGRLGAEALEHALGRPPT